MTLPKVPAIPPANLQVDFASNDVRAFESTLWRVFATKGGHALGWDELRHFGPLPDMRFDPHPTPVSKHPEIGVMYATTRPHTAIGEVFQSTRVIDRAANGRTLVSWKPTRPLTLLDLTSKFLVRNKAAAAVMMMADKQITRAWAKAIYDQVGTKIDGLWHLSSIDSEPMVTLFSRVEVDPAFPARPASLDALDAATADVHVFLAAQNLSYGVV